MPSFIARQLTHLALQMQSTMTTGEGTAQSHEIPAKLQKSHSPLIQSRTIHVSCPIFNFSFKNVIKYIDDQFERYLQDESGLNRRHIMDNRVHCCFYFINPAGHG